jgi:signal transduction histidine kinase/FixJ family two-component response regulator
VLGGGKVCLNSRENHRRIAMSLHRTLVLLYGMLLAVLATAASGFYWAVEWSLADQELLKVARSQLHEVDDVSAKVHVQMALTARTVMMANVDPKLLDEVQLQGATGIQTLIDAVQAELGLLEKRNAAGCESQTWGLEQGELRELLRIQRLYREFCETCNTVVGRHNELERDQLLTTIQECDTKLMNSLDPALNKLRDSELTEMLRREETVMGHSRLLERLAIGTGLATLVVLLVGREFLQRALKELARREAIAAADAAKGEFLASMSHEIRTPMTAILGFADLLSQGLTDPEKLKTVEIIKRNGGHLLEIINDILDMARISAGQIAVERVPCSPWQIVTDAVALMKVRASSNGLELTTEAKGLLPETMLTNPLRLRQILINLVGNAVKFTETGSVRLVVELTSGPDNDRRIRFDVIDTGIGISEEDVKTLFKPFTQAGGASAKAAEGTGLGLAISQRLAGLLGGEIRVKSVFGKGSTFSLVVPTGPLGGVKMLGPKERMNLASAEPTPAVIVGKEKPKLQGRILLVEDGLDNQRLIAYLLRRAGAEVELAEDGTVALEKVQGTMEETGSGERDGSKMPFDVILMDMQMPKMDGYEAARRLRDMGYRRPIIALTAYAMSADRQKCLDAGCDDFASKPISEGQLLRTVAAHMGRRVEVAESTQGVA